MSNILYFDQFVDYVDYVGYRCHKVVQLVLDLHIFQIVFAFDIRSGVNM